MTLADFLYKISEAWNLKAPRPFIEFTIEKISELWSNKNIFIVEAPTGYGKSTISAAVSLYSAEKELKAIICYPLRTLIEDQYNTFTGKKEGKRAICDEELIGVRYMHHPGSRYLIKPITLTTIDTFALTLFGIAPEDFEKALKAYEGISFSFGHYMFSWASVILSNVILDEVHLLADSTKSLNFLIALLELAIRFDQKLVLMSATLPRAFKEVIVDSLRPYLDRIVFITFSKNEELKGVESYTYFDEDFVEERISKKYDLEILRLEESEKFEKLRELIRTHAQKFKRVLVVFNTVEDAMKFYLLVKDDKDIIKIFKENILLIHSRFTGIDRAKKIDKLGELKDRYLLIATQVIEAGIDISSDLFITEIAPANSLVQRLGRFLRYDEKYGKVFVWYEADEVGNLKLNLSLNKTPRTRLCIDAESEEVFKKSVAILKEKFKDVKIKKLSEWKWRKDKLAIAIPMYKVYNYELTLKTLNWLKENKLNVHVPECSSENIKGYKEILNDVYTRSSFQPDLQAVNDLLNIHYHLESPEKAIEVLLKCEGSFVREDYQVNVVPEKHLNKFIGKKEREISKLISKFCISVSVKTLRSLDVAGILFVNEEGFVDFTGLEQKWVLQYPEKLLRGVLTEGRFVSPIAFVIKAYYDEDLGLVVRK